MARVPADATAFAHRDKQFMLLYAGHALDTEGGDAAAAWVERMWSKSKHHSEGVYVNFLGTKDGPERIHDAYPVETYQRLVEVKRKYDPENRFHGNLNIRPS
jgi:FAD/FMN-containing dehydrogenase